MTDSSGSGNDSAGSRRQVLSTGRVVFLVIAAAAPMAAMIGNIPLALIGVTARACRRRTPSASWCCCALLVGYAAMGRRVVNTGAFYTYIARALGRPVGVAAAYVAVVSYTALACGLVGAFGYFTRLVLLNEGLSLPWYLYSAVAVAIVAFLGYRSADLSAKVLGTLMVGEFTVLLVFDGIVAGRRGGAAFPAVSWTWSRGLLRIGGDRADVRVRQLRGLRVRGAVRGGNPRS